MDVLRLSDDQNEWLRGLSSTVVFKDDLTFQQFLEDTAESLVTSKSSFRILSGISRGSERTPEELLAIHQGVAGLSSIFVEAAKKNSAADAVGLYLQAVGLPDNRVKAITNVYYGRRNDFRKALSAVGFSFPQVTDVDWRLDWTIKSNEISRIGMPVYRIKLQTLSGTGEVGSLDFTSSVEELQELVWSLKNAIKSVERHVQP